MGIKFEDKIEEIKNLEGFQSYQITFWNSYKGIVEYYISGVKNQKIFIDDGNNNWIEVSE